MLVVGECFVSAATLGQVTFSCGSSLTLSTSIFFHIQMCHTVLLSMHSKVSDLFCVLLEIRLISVMFRMWVLELNNQDSNPDTAIYHCCLIWGKVLNLSKSSSSVKGRNPFFNTVIIRGKWDSICGSALLMTETASTREPGEPVRSGGWRAAGKPQVQTWHPEDYDSSGNSERIPGRAERPWAKEAKDTFLGN